jgi:predicted RNase H-like nuclease (RuvC/YqgF family)
MGRTNPTYRDALAAIEDRWSPYRRTLRRQDRERFDRLFGYAREHADAAGARNHRNPLVAALVGIVLEHERRHDEAATDREGLRERHNEAATDRERLRERHDDLEARLDDLEAAVDAAALDHQLDAADYPPAINALANRLGDADLPGVDDDAAAGFNDTDEGGE